MLATFLIRKIFLLMSLVISVFFQGNNNHVIKDKKVLIFSKTNGFRHDCIPVGIEAIKKLGTENHFTADATEDSTLLSDANLGNYNEIIFFNTTGTILGADQEKALQNFIHKGGGFVGVHSATDCEYQWPWYVKLIAAILKVIPNNSRQNCWW